MFYPPAGIGPSMDEVEGTMARIRGHKAGAAVAQRPLAAGASFEPRLDLQRPFRAVAPQWSILFITS
jgi:hypothetical protein